MDSPRPNPCCSRATCIYCATTKHQGLSRIYGKQDKVLLIQEKGDEAREDYPHFIDDRNETGQVHVSTTGVREAEAASRPSAMVSV